MNIEDIQPNMRRIVTELNDHGFKTTDSGDGITNVEAGMEGALDFPHVVVLVPYPRVLITKADRMWELVLLLVDIVKHPEVRIEATYEPGNTVATLTLINVTDKILTGDG